MFFFIIEKKNTKTFTKVYEIYVWVAKQISAVSSNLII